MSKILTKKIDLKVLKATKEDSKTVAKILEDAFRDDPVMTWVIPNPEVFSDYFYSLCRYSYY